MDLNTARIVIELCTFVAFVAIVGWAWSGRRVADFQRAAHLPFDADEPRADTRVSRNEP